MRSFLPLLTCCLLGTTLGLIGRPAAAQETPSFIENFLAPDTAWKIDTYDAPYALGRTGLLLKSTKYGCPVFETVSDPFANRDSWTFSFQFRYTTLGNYGTGICCGTNPDGYDNVVKLHQDVNGQFLRVGGHVVWKVAPNFEWHIISVVRRGNTLTAYIDGVKMAAQNVSLAPSTVRVGGGYEKNPWNWNDLQVKAVRVDSGFRRFY